MIKHIAVLFFLFFNQAWAADTITGKVVSIADGDTIIVLDANKTQHKIRLYGVDCPESHQDYGQKAKEFTSGLVFGQNVEVKVMDTDRYGRTVSVVTVGTIILNNDGIPKFVQFQAYIQKTIIECRGTTPSSYQET